MHACTIVDANLGTYGRPLSDFKLCDFSRGSQGKELRHVGETQRHVLSFWGRPRRENVICAAFFGCGTLRFDQHLLKHCERAQFQNLEFLVRGWAGFLLLLLLLLSGILAWSLQEIDHLRGVGLKSDPS